MRGPAVTGEWTGANSIVMWRPMSERPPRRRGCRQRIIRCAAGIAGTVDKYLAGTATDADVMQARQNSAECQ